jgi:hypothetical protein
MPTDGPVIHRVEAVDHSVAYALDLRGAKQGDAADAVRLAERADRVALFFDRAHVQLVRGTARVEVVDGVPSVSAP